MAAPTTRLTLPLPLQFLAAWLAVWLERVLQEQVDFLKAENRLLREKLGGKRIHLTDAERRRLATLGKKLGRKGLAAVATIASPETILRWYRELVARKYDGSGQRGPGRPRRRGEISELVVRMARENETWGYTRIKGALKNLGYKLGRNTIKRTLQEHGIDPAPERGRHMPWAKFIRAHLGALVGMGSPNPRSGRFYVTWQMKGLAGGPRRSCHLREGMSCRSRLRCHYEVGPGVPAEKLRRQVGAGLARGDVHDLCWRTRSRCGT